MQAISRKELIEKLLARKGKGATMFGFDAETVPVLLKFHRTERDAEGKKIPCPFSGIVKRISVSCVIGKNYANAVNRQTLMDNGINPKGDAALIARKLQALGLPVFTPQPRKWGNKIEGTPVIEHNGSHYVECIFREQDGHRVTFLGYFDAQGNKIDKRTLEGYLPKTKQCKENVRDYRADAMKVVRMNGEELAIM